MFFILSKTVAFLLLPSNLLIILGLAGVVLLATRWRRAGARITVASIVLLASAGFLPIGNILIHALESRFPWDAARGAPTALWCSETQYRQGSRVLSASRSWAAVRAFSLCPSSRALKNARIVYSGGDPSLLGGGVRETDFVYPLLDSLGVARERVLLETRSRNTAENAAFSKLLVNPKPGERWLLVTSAQHMPRAVNCFRQAGFPVEPYPVGWRTTRDFGSTWERTLAEGLDRLDSAAYEWIALAAYRLTGRTAELFPSP